jgi:hypothetical protein
MPLMPLTIKFSFPRHSTRLLSFLEFTGHFYLFLTDLLTYILLYFRREGANYDITAARSAKRKTGRDTRKNAQRSQKRQQQQRQLLLQQYLEEHLRAFGFFLLLHYYAHSRLHFLQQKLRNLAQTVQWDAMKF